MVIRVAIFLKRELFLSFLLLLLILFIHFLSLTLNNSVLHLLKLVFLDVNFVLQLKPHALSFYFLELILLQLVVAVHVAQLVSEHLFLLELPLPVLQLPDHPTPSQLHVLNLLHFPVSHFLPPHGVPLVQVLQELLLCIHQGVLAPSQYVIAVGCLQCVLHPSHQQIVTDLILNPLLLNPIQLFFHLPKINSKMSQYIRSNG